MTPNRAAVALTAALEVSPNHEFAVAFAELGTRTDLKQHKAGCELASKALVKKLQADIQAKALRWELPITRQVDALGKVATGLEVGLSSSQVTKFQTELLRLAVQALPDRPLLGITDPKYPQVVSVRASHIPAIVLALAARAEPDAAVGIALEALNTTDNPEDGAVFLAGLRVTINRLEGNHSEEIVRRAAAIVCKKLSLDSAISWQEAVQTLVQCTERMEPEQAAAVCNSCATVMFVTERVLGGGHVLQPFAELFSSVPSSPVPGSGEGYDFTPDTLESFVQWFPITQLRVYQTAAFAIVTPGVAGPLVAVPFQHPYFRSRQIDPQTLVEFLKHPFCVGQARRVVLDALELTYHRKFADQWEFVQFVHDNKLSLDLLTPPKRPQKR